MYLENKHWIFKINKKCPFNEYFLDKQNQSHESIMLKFWMTFLSISLIGTTLMSNIGKVLKTKVGVDLCFTPYAKVCEILSN